MTVAKPIIYFLLDKFEFVAFIGRVLKFILYCEIRFPHRFLTYYLSHRGRGLLPYRILGVSLEISLWYNCTASLMREILGLSAVIQETHLTQKISDVFDWFLQDFLWHNVIDQVLKHVDFSL